MFKYRANHSFGPEDDALFEDATLVSQIPTAFLDAFPEPSCQAPPPSPYNPRSVSIQQTRSQTGETLEALSKGGDIPFSLFVRKSARPNPMLSLQMQSSIHVPPKYTPGQNTVPNAQLPSPLSPTELSFSSTPHTCLSSSRNTSSLLLYTRSVTAKRPLSPPSTTTAVKKPRHLDDSLASITCDNPRAVAREPRVKPLPLDAAPSKVATPLEPYDPPEEPHSSDTDSGSYTPTTGPSRSSSFSSLVSAPPSHYTMSPHSKGSIREDNSECNESDECDSSSACDSDEEEEDPFLYLRGSERIAKLKSAKEARIRAAKDRAPTPMALSVQADDNEDGEESEGSLWANDDAEDVENIEGDEGREDEPANRQFAVIDRAQTAPESVVTPLSPKFEALPTSSSPPADRTIPRRSVSYMGRRLSHPPLPLSSAPSNLRGTDAFGTRIRNAVVRSVSSPSPSGIETRRGVPTAIDIEFPRDDDVQDEGFMASNTGECVFVDRFDDIELEHTLSHNGLPPPLSRKRKLPLFLFSDDEEEGVGGDGVSDYSSSAHTPPLRQYSRLSSTHPSPNHTSLPALRAVPQETPAISKNVSSEEAALILLSLLHSKSAPLAQPHNCSISLASPISDSADDAPFSLDSSNSIDLTRSSASLANHSEPGEASTLECRKPSPQFGRLSRISLDGANTKFATNGTAFKGPIIWERGSSAAEDIENVELQYPKFDHEISSAESQAVDRHPFITSSTDLRSHGPSCTSLSASLQYPNTTHSATTNLFSSANDMNVQASPEMRGSISNPPNSNTTPSGLPIPTAPGPWSIQSYLMHKSSARSVIVQPASSYALEPSLDAANDIRSEQDSLRAYLSMPSMASLLPVQRSVSHPTYKESATSSGLYSAPAAPSSAFPYVTSGFSATTRYVPFPQSLATPRAEYLYPTPRKPMPQQSSSPFNPYAYSHNPFHRRSLTTPADRIIYPSQPSGTMTYPAYTFPTTTMSSAFPTLLTTTANNTQQQLPCGPTRSQQRPAFGGWLGPR